MYAERSKITRSVVLEYVEDDGEGGILVLEKRFAGSFKATCVLLLVWWTQWVVVFELQ